MGKKASHAGQGWNSSSAEVILLEVLYRLEAIENGAGSVKEEEVESMEDLEAEEEEEEARLNGWGSSKALEMILVSDSMGSCFWGSG